MKKAELIFNSYNKAIENAYIEFFSSNASKRLEESEAKTEEFLNAYVFEVTSKWEHSPSNDLDGLKPFEYFNDIKDLDKLIEIFKFGAEVCDEDIPEALLQCIKSFGEKAEDRLIELALNSEYHNARKADDLNLIPLYAIRVLGKWGVGKATKGLIQLLFTLTAKEEDELLKESIKEALISIGEASIVPTLEILEGADNIGDSHEYLMIALSNIGANNKSDRIYKCLKETFLKMKNKTIGAICLGAYGDGRAVAALRGYLEKNKGNIDEETFYEVKVAVVKLGGSMDDII